MSEEKQRPKVGVGVYIRKDGKVLLGQRKGAHGGGYWAAPGGHLEFGESWDECVLRETVEETGLDIENIRFIGATNDIFPETHKHYITLAMVADWKAGEPRVLEPDKCVQWEWFAWDALPEPLFVPTRNFLKSGYNPLNFNQI